MSRLVLVVCLIAQAGTSSNPGLGRTLQAVEDRYNKAQTLQLTFSEGYTAQGRRRKPESGTLFLRKPGRMRWQYDSPADKLILSDGKFLFIVTPDSDRVQKMAAKETEDMRAPLAFLLGRLHFEKEFQNLQARPEGVNIWISGEPKSPNLPYTKVEFEVTPQMEIARVQVTGQDYSVTDFRFSGEKLNPALDRKLFEFRLPPGRVIEETTGN